MDKLPADLVLDIFTKLDVKEHMKALVAELSAVDALYLINWINIRLDELVDIQREEARVHELQRLADLKASFQVGEVCKVYSKEWWIDCRRFKVVRLCPKSLWAAIIRDNGTQDAPRLIRYDAIHKKLPVPPQ